MILILGNQDSHTKRVLDLLHEAGEEAFILDTRVFPTSLELDFDPVHPEHGKLFLKPNAYTGHTETLTIPLSDLKSVYWYTYMGLAPEVKVGHLSPLMPTEAETFLLAFLDVSSRAGGTLWVNPPHTVYAHQYKSAQLRTIAALGVEVPETLMTNSPQALKAFFDAHPEGILTKSMSASGIPQTIKAEDFAPEVLGRLVTSPSIFQAKVPGIDVRVHVVGDEIFPTEIIAEGEGHFKLNRNLVIQACEIPDAIAEQSRLIANILDLKLTGIDYLRTDDGRYVYLEANPSPQFCAFDDVIDGQISAALVRLLRKGVSK